MEYYFVHEYQGKTYYIKTPTITEAEKQRNKILFNSSFGIHKMLIKDEYGVTELITNSVKKINITDGIYETK